MPLIVRPWMVCNLLNQGTISKGDMLFNLNSGKKLKVPRLVRMHSAEMQVRSTCVQRRTSLSMSFVLCSPSSVHICRARLHSATQDVDAVAAGDVVAMFGVDCSSMDTFTDGR